MLVNDKITHYHKAYDKTTRDDKWIRYNYDNIHFMGGKGASLNKGLTDANDFKARIWYGLNDVDINNFSSGDIIVKGKIEEDITTQKDLSNREHYMILSITDVNYVKIAQNKHIFIGGK